MKIKNKYIGSHDQNFKNLTVDYPIQSIEFFAHKVFPKIEGNPNVSFLRQEQQKDKLYEGHTELDIPILLEWPERNEKAAVIFSIEPESDPYDFDPIRLAEYCLKLMKEYKTKRVVPVVIFLKPGKYKEGFTAGTEVFETINFSFIACQLPYINYHEWCDSNNIVVRITLPLMGHQGIDKLEVVRQSMRGLYELETSKRLQKKYTPFITHYAELDETDIIEYQRRYSEEGVKMASYIQQQLQKSTDLGVQQGVKQGLERGAAQRGRELFLRLIKRRFPNQLSASHKIKLENASSSDIDRWVDNILDAKTIDDVFA